MLALIKGKSGIELSAKELLKAFNVDANKGMTRRLIAEIYHLCSFDDI